MYLGLEMRPGKLVERSVYGAAAHAARRKRWGVDATITVRRRWTALARSGYLIRDLANPCQPIAYAQKPRKETEEKACSSERAKEAVR